MSRNSEYVRFGALYILKYTSLFFGRTDGIYSHQGSTQVQILGDLNGVYCQSRYRTDRDVEVNPKLPNALRGALSAGCLYQRKILPTRLPDNIHVLIRKAALPALFRGSVREGDPFSIPYRALNKNEPWESPHRPSKQHLTPF